jgi:BirA family biotin operon repressor/biotin-[acetyl-CoA-carboxylase] ligase
MSPDGEKVAGILLERAGDAVVIGFGVNLLHHPQGLERPVSSIEKLFGHAPEPQEFLGTLAGTFGSWLARWRLHGLDPVRRAWLRAAHPLGTPLSTPEGEGLYAGLDGNGALMLKRPDGSLRLVHAGDVFLL